MRGASYFTIGRNVRPAEAGDSESYAGPTWDLIRITEAQPSSTNQTDSLWRLFYINTSTGLIDRIVHQEQEQMISVELSQWIDRAGELEPTLIRWALGQQVVMELSFTDITYGPRQ
jgi:hypothetical protein